MEQLKETTTGIDPWRHQDTRAIIDGELGFRRTLTAARTEVEMVAALLRDYVLTGAPTMEKPIQFDSFDMCVSTYTEALERVKQRFWTTTSLSSGFWINNDPRVLHANSRLIARLRRDDNTVRRLFLLHLPPDREVERWQDEHMRLRKF